MDSKFIRRIEELEKPERLESEWQEKAEARERVSLLTAMVREHMGPDEQSSVAEYVMKHAPEEPHTDIERAMFVLKDGTGDAEGERTTCTVTPMTVREVKPPCGDS